MCKVYLDNYLVSEYSEAVRAATLGDRINIHTYNYAYGGTFSFDYLYVWTEA